MNSTLPAPYYQTSLRIPTPARFDLDLQVENISWPSLYDPRIDFGAHPGAGPVQPGGKYLTHVDGTHTRDLYIHVRRSLTLQVLNICI